MYLFAALCLETPILAASAQAQNVSFIPRRDFAAGVPVSVAVGDFNGDAVQDLAVAGGSNDVSVLINNTHRINESQAATAEITPRLGVIHSGFRYSRTAQRYEQTGTLQNLGTRNHNDNGDGPRDRVRSTRAALNPVQGGTFTTCDLPPTRDHPAADLASNKGPGVCQIRDHPGGRIWVGVVSPSVAKRKRRRWMDVVSGGRSV